MVLVHRVLSAKGEEYAEELRCPSTVLRPPRSSRAEAMPGETSGEVSDQKTQDAMLGKNGPGRNAGEEHAGTQGWRRSRQDAMPASRGNKGSGYKVRVRKYGLTRTGLENRVDKSGFC